MRRLFLVLLLAAATTACTGKSSSTTPVRSEPISGATLTSFMQHRFAAQVTSGALVLETQGLDDMLTEELSLMGITTTGQLAAIVPADFDSKGFGAETGPTNVAALLRDLMIIKDARLYFTTAWRNNWAANGRQDFTVAAAYGVDLDMIEGLGVFGGEGVYDPCMDGEGDGDGEGDPCGE